MKFTFEYACRAAQYVQISALAERLSFFSVVLSCYVFSGFIIYESCWFWKDRSFDCYDVCKHISYVLCGNYMLTSVEKGKFLSLKYHLSSYALRPHSGYNGYNGG
jgi:hypothetical protein